MISQSMLVYLSICSLVGGLSVVATQGLGAAIVTQISGTAQFNHWFIYILLAFVICTLSVEIVYLNVSCTKSTLRGTPLLTRLTESTQPLQCRTRYAYLLRLFHFVHHRHLRNPIPWIQGHTPTNHHDRNGLSANLLWCRTFAALKIREGRA